MSKVLGRLARFMIVSIILVGTASQAAPGRAAPVYKISTFSVDVTPPLRHPLLAGLSPPAVSIDDPLFVRGLVLTGSNKPIVLASVDWCEIRNDAYERWRKVLADAAETIPECVLVTSIHQHDAPLADLEAQRILDQYHITEGIIDFEFHERIVRNVGDAVRKSLESAQTVTHYGVGKARVERIASNRRYLDAGGKPRHDRMSSMTPSFATEQPEGTIDPWLRTLSFWDGERPIAAVSAYAVHPMAYWGTGRVSADFPGLARTRRQTDNPDIFQIYVSGASGNVIAGKYNDGKAENRRILADRLYDAMGAAWNATERHPLENVGFRAVPLKLEPRTSSGFSPEELRQQIISGKTPIPQRAAMGLSWLKRCESGPGLIIPAIDLGRAQFVLLPGESYVEFQLLAQQERSDSFVMVAGYGECAPGYIPIERAWIENDSNLDTWCWIAPGAERAMASAIKAVLAPNNN